MMAVDPKYQRQGIGSRMMERMCEEIDQHGSYAYVLASPEGARLYSKFGFAVVGEVRTAQGVIASMLRQPHRPSEP
jgi:predicted N-acetyltransferase YhbS